MRDKRAYRDARGVMVTALGTIATTATYRYNYTFKDRLLLCRSIGSERALDADLVSTCLGP